MNVATKHGTYEITETPIENPCHAITKEFETIRETVDFYLNGYEGSNRIGLAKRINKNGKEHYEIVNLLDPIDKKIERNSSFLITMKKVSEDRNCEPYGNEVIRKRWHGKDLIGSLVVLRKKHGVIEEQGISERDSYRVLAEREGIENVTTVKNKVKLAGSYRIYAKQVLQAEGKERMRDKTAELLEKSKDKNDRIGSAIAKLQLEKQRKGQIHE
jgi:hypothetical protein